MAVLIMIYIIAKYDLPINSRAYQGRQMPASGSWYYINTIVSFVK